MLAQATYKAGYTFFVIDLYADADTRLYAQDCYTTPSLAKKHLAPVVDSLLLRYPITHVVYGSGFENHSESLYYLAERLQIWGNHPDVFTQIQDKNYFFRVLDGLNIPYPSVSFTLPENNTGNWLVKPLQGQGGVGIKHYYPNNNVTSTIYWQQYKQGSSHSVLFVADGENLQLIGFNSQWSITLSQHDFIFSGIINECTIPHQHKSTLTTWLKKIVEAFILKGLNSMDFIYADDRCYVLEINARPPASIQLYDNNLLVRHIEACQGKLISLLPSQPRCKGYQIIYAEHDITIPPNFEWPSWCMDLPNAGSLIHTEQPICSIIASAMQSQQVMQQLVIKQQLIINKLNGSGHYGI
jgi:uncharacterized protein